MGYIRKNTDSLIPGIQLSVLELKHSFSMAFFFLSPVLRLCFLASFAGFKLPLSLTFYAGSTHMAHDRLCPSLKCTHVMPGLHAHYSWNFCWKLLAARHPSFNTPYLLPPQQKLFIGWICQIHAAPFSCSFWLWFDKVLLNGWDQEKASVYVNSEVCFFKGQNTKSNEFFYLCCPPALPAFPKLYWATIPCLLALLLLLPQVLPIPITIFRAGPSHPPWK